MLNITDVTKFKIIIYELESFSLRATLNINFTHGKRKLILNYLNVSFEILYLLRKRKGNNARSLNNYFRHFKS